jgi:hypothetical protein
MKRILALMCLANSFVFSQNVGINETGNVADPSAILDVEASDKGVLIPRVDLLSRTDVITVPSPAPSLLVFNNATSGAGNNAVSPGYYYWDGTIWVRIGATGDFWELEGNTGTTASTAPIDQPTTDNFIGTTDNQDFVISTNGFERMRLKSDNNQTIRVGIGTTFAPSFPFGAGNTPTLLHVFDGGFNAGDFAQLQLGSAKNTATNKVGEINFHSSVSSADRRTGGIESYITAVSSIPNVSGDLRIFTNNNGTYSEKVRVQPNGRVGIGNTNPGAQLEVAQVVNAPTAIFGNYGNVNNIFIRRSQGTLASPTNNGNGSSLGRFVFQGYNGSFLNAAQIESNIDGAPSSTSMPGRLVFSTTPSGSTTVSEAMRINREQNIRIGATGANTSNPNTADATNIRLDVQGGFVRFGSYNNDPGINAAGPGRSFANGVGALAVGMNRNAGTSGVDLWNTTSNTQPAAAGINDRGFYFRQYDTGGNENLLAFIRGDGEVHATAFVNISDERTKSEFSPLANVLEKIMEIQTYEYTLNNRYYDSLTGQLIFADYASKSDFGFKAQELQALFPKVVSIPDDEETQLYGVKYDKMVVVLTKAIQEQQSIIESQEMQIETLSDKIEALENLILQVLNNE